MNRPLLSISIPTWNRASILEIALSQLLPQLIEFKDCIELIISDNCSTDNTSEVINNFKLKFKSLNIIHFTQQQNTGYYGNFKKCKELANGCFFWLLSDNEFINNGLISTIISLIKNNEDISSLHLVDWENYSDEKSFKNVNYRWEKVSNGDLITLAGYKLTLISAVIFKNYKSNDTSIFEKFKGNSFLGFVLFLDSLSTNDKSIMLYSNSLISKYSKVSFNVFDSFTKDMKKCVDYGLEKKVLNPNTEENLMNSIIENLTKHHYASYRINGTLYGIHVGSIESLNANLKIYLSKYSKYHTSLLPLINSSRVEIILRHFFKKIYKKLKFN